MKIGLALGSGAARGLAHIGVLKAFQEAEIPVYAISGSSMGAFIGGLYAAGYDVFQMEKLIYELDWKIFTEFFDLKITKSGLVDGKKIDRFIYEFIGDVKIENLDLKFCCVATDLFTGKEIIFNSGSLIKAIRASISFPGVFIPAYLDGMFLVDGGLKNPVPVNRLPEDCDVKIAVHVGPFAEKDDFINKYYSNGENFVKDNNIFVNSINKLLKEILRINIDNGKVKYPNIFEILVQSIAIMQEATAEYVMDDVDCIKVKPDLDGYKLTDFTKAKEIISIGYEEGYRLVNQLISMEDVYESK
ncbi:patatin-like phospholipase family protein [Deferribacter desulfuricans SSM1]|uniref:Patatin-like phospholipase family protein n=1 Tax=Deferribacter desulfuricans (strain DSM 14783 / JCM 11476 / NBRC 101012 / SSM1) TaxID=639282 RepID=D3PDQ3_DEFDS|nr:patatin-like phospholipase family protein [Deferribacter desulfuricans]BAI80726.1 patatin-like phospholipase family protein [Deferribacter desulfuricans SSM1]